jgi:hypothetical protein
MSYPFCTFATASTLFLAAALPGPAVAQRNPLFTADQEACFGRVYDRAHMASHPNQKVTSLHILRTLGERKEAENWQPDSRAEEIKRFRESGESGVSAFVTFRDRKGYFYNFLSCGKEGRDGVRCYIECDGGSFALKRESASAALLTNNGFVLVGGCGDDVEEGKEVYFEPGKDDKVFRLDAKAPAVCRAEEQKAVPLREGKPLRERFKEDEAFCFGSDYDAAHLASHPKQMVASLRVGRLDPAAEKEPDAAYKSWWFNVKLSVLLTLKGGGDAAAVRYTCFPATASWDCRREGEAETHNACNDRTIQLVRGPGDDILVYNRNSGLPIDKECETAKDTGQYPERPLTRSDDKSFRLSRMPVQACR